MKQQPSDKLCPGLVSIGMPVYNGARYLRNALSALLAQDYTLFEIIISDNCSTDETEVICREYMARDPRIRYYRTDRNMGAGWNFKRVYELARGEYFMWNAHDDLRAPQCLSRCVAAMEQNPRALLCCVGVRFIDEHGHDVSDAYPFRVHHPTGTTPRERLQALVCSACWLDVYSLIRTNALASITQKFDIWGGDLVLLADLCLRGEVVAVPEKLLNYRYFPTKTPEDVARTISTTAVSVKVSWSDLATELLETVWRSPLSVPEKLSVAWMITLELCLRNRSIGWGIREERFSAARRAFACGKYRRAVMLTFIGLLKQTAAFVDRVKNSALFRGDRLKRALSRSERARSGRGPGY